MVDLCGDRGLVGDLAGATHLLNVGVPRSAYCEQKSHVDQKGKNSHVFAFECDYKL